MSEEVKKAEWKLSNSDSYRNTVRDGIRTLEGAIENAKIVPETPATLVGAIEVGEVPEHKSIVIEGHNELRVKAVTNLLGMQDLTMRIMAYDVPVENGTEKRINLSILNEEFDRLSEGLTDLRDKMNTQHGGMENEETQAMGR